MKEERIKCPICGGKVDVGYHEERSSADELLRYYLQVTCQTCPYDKIDPYIKRNVKVEKEEKDECHSNERV